MDLEVAAVDLLLQKGHVFQVQIKMQWWKEGKEWFCTSKF